MIFRSRVENPSLHRRQASIDISSGKYRLADGNTHTAWAFHETDCICYLESFPKARKVLQLSPWVDRTFLQSTALCKRFESREATMGFKESASRSRFLFSLKQSMFSLAAGSLEDIYDSLGLFRRTVTFRLFKENEFVIEISRTFYVLLLAS